MQCSGDIDCEADLSPYSRAGFVLSAEQGKREAEAIANRICPSSEALQLVSGQPACVSEASVRFGAECQARGEIVK